MIKKIAFELRASDTSDSPIGALATAISTASLLAALETLRTIEVERKR